MMEVPSELASKLLPLRIPYLLVFMFFAGLPKVSYSLLASAFCVQLGQANTNLLPSDPGYATSASGKLNLNGETMTFYYRSGYWTIGTRKFDVKFNFLDFDYNVAGYLVPDWNREPDYTGFNVNDNNIIPRRRRRGITDSDEEFIYNNLKSDGGHQPLLMQGNLSKADSPFSGYNIRNTSTISSHRRTKRQALTALFEEHSPPTYCPYTWGRGNYPSANYCPDDDEVEIKAYAVKERIPGEPDRVLNGWLYFEIELKDPNDEILAIYIQVRDEFFNAIGEFVPDPKEQCNKGPKKEFGQPTPFQILPCSAVGFREAKISNALFMAREQALMFPDRVKPKHLPPDDQPKKGVRFTWRLSEYWCNRHLRIRPEALIFTKKMYFIDRRNKRPFTLRKAANYWIKHKWYGAADIKRENTELSCNEEVINYKTGQLLNAAPWLDDSERSTLENDYIHSKQRYLDTAVHPPVGTLKSCQANVRLTKYDINSDKTVPKYAKDIVPTFAGRCTHHYEKTPRHDALQGCNLDRTADEFKDLIKQYPNIATYSSYVTNLFTSRINLCSAPCVPPTIDNLPDILGYPDRSGETSFKKTIRYNRDSRLNRSTQLQLVFSGRKYHAVMSIYWTMFLMPVGIFFARYLKESCMSVSCYGAHLWFWIHIAASILTVFVAISGWTGISQSLDTWGRSEQMFGMIHRLVGFGSCFLFVLMVVLGALRSLHVKARLLMMTLHSIIGFFVYFGNNMAMLTSAFIPGSPTMGDNCDDDGNPTMPPGKVIYVMLMWMIMDFLLHLTLSIVQVHVDRVHGIRRAWYCPIIPILPHNALQDLVGTILRKMTMGVYAGAAFIMTHTAVAYIYAAKPENTTCLALLGPRTCNITEHPFGCSSAALAYEKYVNSTEGLAVSGSY